FGVPLENAVLRSPIVVPRSAIVKTVQPPLSRIFMSPRNCRTVRPLNGEINGEKFVKTKSPNRSPEVPGRNPASEKSTLNSSPRTSPPKAPDTVDIGLTTLPLSGANGPIDGMYTSTLAASVKTIVKPLLEPVIPPPADAYTVLKSAASSVAPGSGKLGSQVLLGGLLGAQPPQLPWPYVVRSPGLQMSALAAPA